MDQLFHSQLNPGYPKRGPRPSTSSGSRETPAFAKHFLKKGWGVCFPAMWKPASRCCVTCLQASIRKSSRHTVSISAWNRRPGSSLAFAWNTVWSFRTFSDPVRLSPVITPCFLPVWLSNQGSFPPPALPGLCGTTSPSATLPARPGPRGFPVGACAPPTGLPVLPTSSPPCVPPPLPRRNRPVLASLASRPMAAFPGSLAGRFPPCAFRGLLGLHSRYGPHGR